MTRASSPIRLIRLTRASRSGSCKPPARRSERRQDNKLDKVQAMAQGVLGRSRKQGGIATNEVAHVARSADRFCARRLRLRASVRAALRIRAIEVQGPDGGRNHASGYRGMVAQLPRPDAQ